MLQCFRSVADLNEILKEQDACGVGFIASLKNEASHKVVEQGLTALSCMEHRGGCSADNDSGDGAGLMTGIPWALLSKWLEAQGKPALDAASTGVGMVFLPRNPELAAAAKAVVNSVCEKEHLEVLGWRPVPVDEAVVGKVATNTLPTIEQLLVKVPAGMDGDDIERELFLVRKLVEKAVAGEAWGEELYFCSLSRRTIVYKGMLRSEVVGRFYLDLKNPEFVSPFAIYHRRYSTNTTPNHPRSLPALPLQGNLNWMTSRETTLTSPVWKGREAELCPIGNTRASDSANLDTVAEVLLHSGRSPEAALMVLVPEAYKNHPTLQANNGTTVGACLDRNGLRPARFWRTADDMVYVASEVGVLGSDDKNVVAKGRLGPGMMISVNLETGQVQDNTAIKRRVAVSNPYAQWMKEKSRALSSAVFEAGPALSPEELMRRHTAYGYTSEDVTMVVESMASQGKEPTFCMGDDTPLAVLSGREQLLYNYFKQRFAQVTNPAIDPLREGLVMSLDMNLGKRENLLVVGPENANQAWLWLFLIALYCLLLPPPLRVQVCEAKRGWCNVARLVCTASAICPYLAFETCRHWRLQPKTEKLMSVGKLPFVTVEAAQNNFRKAVNAGLLKILSKMGISLLASYHGAQIFEIYGLGQEVVDYAFKGSVSRIGGLTLDEVAKEAAGFWGKGFAGTAAKKLENVGYLTSRVGGEYHSNNPEMSKLLHKAVRSSNAEAYSVYQDHLSSRDVNVLRDLLELKSERQPIPLERVEPASGIVERFCTAGMLVRARVWQDPVRWRHLSDVSEDGLSPTFPHLKGLQNGDTATSAIKQVASGRFGVTPTFLANADQLEIKVAQGAKPGEGGQLPGKKVSPYIATLRNSKAGVPLISPPPHHDIYSIEDLAQLIYDLHQVNPAAKVSVKLVAEVGIGTVASGVAKANADIIQISGHDGGTGASPISSIKHAGGPWELGLTETHQSLVANNLRERVVLRVDGGLKCGNDVVLAAAMGGDEYGFGSVAMIATGCIMARICHTNNCPVGREELRARFPGVPGDLVNFFLFVAEEVRVALAELGFEKLDDIIGHTELLRMRDVGLQKTEALDLSFILTGQGTPQQSSTERRAQPVHSNGPVLDDELLANPEVRPRTLPGTTMARTQSLFHHLLQHQHQHHLSLSQFLNVSVKTAIEEEKAAAVTSKIINVDRATCGRVAGAIAKKYGDSGFAGQLDLTTPTRAFLVRGWAGSGLGLGLGLGLVAEQGQGTPQQSSTERRAQPVHSNGPVLDDELLANPEVRPRTLPGTTMARTQSLFHHLLQHQHQHHLSLSQFLNVSVKTAIEEEKAAAVTSKIINVDRATCGRVAGAIAKKYGDSGFAGQLDLTFEGSAGQSFGCFLTSGMNVRLVGEANDYVGKGMAGGEIVVVPPEGVMFVPEQATIVGNTCLYGATGGQLFARGLAGERFAVRNSMAEAVLEGTGDHCCEYMTGGCVVVLGKVGRNVGAGMTGGLAYFLDEDDTFPAKVNKEIVAMQRVSTPAGEAQLRRLIQSHVDKTGSARGALVLSEWEKYLPQFWQLVPPSEANTPEAKPEVGEEKSQELIAQAA
eukprot:jgi/Mesen1/4764/ME000242S03939